MNGFKYYLSIAICLSISVIGFAQGDEEGFYKGNHAPDADYILSGGLIKDLPPMPFVDVNYDGKGYSPERLSKVPEAGVHPRVILSPSDIDHMKAMVAKGDEAPRYFRLQLEGLRRTKEWEVPGKFEYYANPFGADGNIAKWALLAMLTDDDDLGRKAAKATVDHALYLEPRVDIINTEPSAKHFKDVSYDFLRAELRFGPYTYAQAYYDGGRERVMAMKEKYGIEYFHHSTPGGYLTLGWEYDYAYNYMTDDERDIVRRVISKVSYGKFDTGMAIPGQMYINNHMSAGANWIPLALAIEGEEGFDDRILPIAHWSLVNKLSYDLSSDGLTYENTKGYIPMLAVLSVARRYDGDLLKHSHLMAKAYSEVQHARKIYNRYIPRNRRRPGVDEPELGCNEPRFWRSSASSGSGGHIEYWHVLNHFYPNNPMVEFVSSIKNSFFNADMFEGKSDEKYNGSIYRSWFELPALAMLTAEYEHDYNDSTALSQFDNLDEFWFDDERGIVSMRNGWDQDAMLVHLENRIDQYYGGHETPQQGDFQVWSDGVSWSPNVGAYRDASYRALVTVNGLAGVYQPVSGDWMTAHNTDVATVSVSEMTTAYGWRKIEKLFELDHPSMKQVPHIMGRFKETAYKLDRYTELPFQQKIKEHYDGFGHLDYGPWHGETRGLERYQKWANAMDHVFRTINFARGENPYLLIFDDLNKDGKPQQYDWRMPIAGDACVMEINPAAQNRQLTLDTEGAIGTDIILSMSNETLRRSRAATWGASYPIVKPNPKKGDPMLLVRVLWRHTNFPYPVPNVQKSWGYNMISIPAYGVSPDYKVMVYPYRYGEKLPTTTWSDDMSTLTVSVGDVKDVYTFGKTDRERTIFTMKRNGEKVISSEASPAAPLLTNAPEWTVDQNKPDWKPAQSFVDQHKVAFENVIPGATIYYTLDGSTPTSESLKYNGSIILEESCELKARTYHSQWEHGAPWSAVSSYRFEKVNPQEAVELANLRPGLVTKAYEIKTTIYNKDGFFIGAKNAIPNLDRYDVQVVSQVTNFDIPVMQGQHPSYLMHKGFYTFDGYFYAQETGVYHFELESCGPIDFRVGTKDVIRVDQQYGLSYKKRYGEVVLSQGYHPLHLMVCDPVFWKGDIEEHYTINVGVKHPLSAAFTPVLDEELFSPQNVTISGEELAVGRVVLAVDKADSEVLVAYTIDGSDPTVDQASDLKQIVVEQEGQSVLKMAAFKGGQQLGDIIERRVSVLYKKAAVDAKTVQGVKESRFDRIPFLPKDGNIPADGLAAAYFDVSAAKAYAIATKSAMSENDSPRKLIKYEGLIYAPYSGIYRFGLDNNKKTCAQLMVGGVTVAQQRVDMPKVLDQVYLEEGLHPYVLKLASGKPNFYMMFPNTHDFQLITSDAISVPMTPAIFVNDQLTLNYTNEVFKAALVRFSSPSDQYRILYGINGQAPKMRYKKALSVSENTEFSVALYDGKTQVGETKQVKIAVVDIPQKGMIVNLACEEINQGLSSTGFDNNSTATVQGGTIVEGKRGNAIALEETFSQIILGDMPACEDAVSVAMWVKRTGKNSFWLVTGAPYQYEEYVLCLRGNTMQIEYSRSIGLLRKAIADEDIDVGKWFHIAGTYGDENRIYLNGEFLGAVQVLNKSHRRGSGRAPKINLVAGMNGAPAAILDECKLYDRVLTAEEIKAIYEAEK